LEYGPNAKGERTKRMSNDPPRAASKDTNNESGEKAGLCIELIRNPGGVVTWNDINCNATGLGGALCSKNKE
jgi:hypothetical protein